MFIRKRSFKANELLEREIQYDPVKKQPDTQQQADIQNPKS